MPASTDTYLGLDGSAERPPTGETSLTPDGTAVWLAAEGGGGGSGTYRPRRLRRGISLGL